MDVSWMDDHLFRKEDIHVLYGERRLLP